MSLPFKCVMISFLLAVLMASAMSGAAQNRTSADSQRILKEEVIQLTPPPGCKLTFKVIESKELTTTSIAFLRSLGYGVKGVAEGTGLPVNCDDVTGSGWIDAAGELQSFIVAVKGWFFERLGSGSKPLDGKLHIITKSLPLQGKDVEGTYVTYVGAPLSPYSTRLFNDIGVGIRGTPSPVLVRIGDGRKLKGRLTGAGGVTVTADPWAN